MQAALCWPTRATRDLVFGRCLIARSTRRCSSKRCDWSGFQLRLLPPQSGVSGKLLNKFVCLIQYLRLFVGPTVYYQKRRFRNIELWTLSSVKKDWCAHDSTLFSNQPHLHWRSRKIFKTSPFQQFPWEFSQIHLQVALCNDPTQNHLWGFDTCSFNKLRSRKFRFKQNHITSLYFCIPCALHVTANDEWTSNPVSNYRNTKYNKVGHWQQRRDSVFLVAQNSTKHNCV